MPVPGVQRPCSSPPSILSVGYADTSFGFPPEAPVFDDEAREPPSCQERVPGLVGFGWTSSAALPPWSGSRRSDCRGSCCLETTPNRGRCRPTGIEAFDRHTQRVVSTPLAPKDQLCVDRCGSMTELLSAIVDVRRHRRVATARARPACSPRRSGTGHRSTHPPTNLLSSSSFGAHETQRPRPKPQPPSTPQIADRTTVRPPSTSLATRVPPPDPLATRHHTRSSHVLVSPRPSSCPEDLAFPTSGSGSTQRTGWSFPRAPPTTTSPLLETGITHHARLCVPRGMSMSPPT